MFGGLTRSHSLAAFAGVDVQQHGRVRRRPLLRDSHRRRVRRRAGIEQLDYRDSGQQAGHRDAGDARRERKEMRGGLLLEQDMGWVDFDMDVLYSTFKTP